jgi:MATE family multidrug resistance protein
MSAVEDAVPASTSWRGELRALIRLATPIVLARLGIQMMGLADAVVVGRFSAQQLGYHALGWTPTVIILSSAIGLLSGVQIYTARRVGEGRPELVGVVLRRGLVYALQLGIGATALLALGAPPLLQALGMEADLARGAGVVAVVFSLSLVPYLLSMALSYHLEAVGRTQPGMWGMWVANAVNLAMLLWLVPGGFGVAPLGAIGAAWSTFVARIFLLVWMAVAVLRGPAEVVRAVFARPVREPHAEAEQRRVGYGAGLSVAAEVSAFTGMNIIAAWISPIAVAAWAVTQNLTAVIFMIPLGLAGAAAVRVGRAYGARDAAGVARATLTAAGLAAAIALGISALVAVFARPLAAVYATDPALLAMAAPAVMLCAAFLVPDAVQVVLANALRARADVVMPTILHIASFLGLMLPLGWFLALPMGMGVSGCVWAVVVASFVVTGLLFARYGWLRLRGAKL